MICERCDGKGITKNEVQPNWAPKAWDGQERRTADRQDPIKWAEVQAPLYVTCEACEGLGRILPGLTIKK